jgi:uncharacterized protein YecE (DUF72 family)
MMTDSNPYDNFLFRDIHPGIRLGTASDRYAGWIGQIYSDGRYQSQTRSHKVGGKTFTEEVLPVESVREYFQHFPILEIDYTFYRLLLDTELKPTQNYHVLETYRKHLTEQDRLILKVPQVICARRLWRGGKFVENPDYLNPDIFTRRFYLPALEILGDIVGGFIFEQEYIPQKDRIPPEEFAEGLDQFFSAIPEDNHYHIETRTEYYHKPAYFFVLRKHGVGHIFSHWTWLPALRKQFIRVTKRFFNSDGECIVRLLTPLRMKYDESYSQAFPFHKIVDGMMNPEMIPDTVEILKTATEKGVSVNVIVNNRAGGNAPLIAREIAAQFLKASDE